LEKLIMGRFKTTASVESYAKGSRMSFIYNVPEGVSVCKLIPGAKDGEKSQKMLIDIIPYEDADGNGQWQKTFHTHYVNGKQFLCPSYMAGKKCPACERRNNLDWRDPANKDLRKELKVSSRIICNIIDLKDDNDKGIQLLESSVFCFGDPIKDKLNILDEDEKDFINFAEYDEGYSLSLSIKEQTSPTIPKPYPKVVDVRFVDRKHQYTYDEIKDAVNLDVIFKPLLTPDEILEILDADTFEFEDTEESNTSHNVKQMREQLSDSKPSKSKSSKHEEDDEHETSSRKKKSNEEEDVIVQSKKVKEDDDNYPTPKGKKSSSLPFDEDEVETTASSRKKKVDDDEDDEVPVKKEVSKKKKRPVEDDEDEEETRVSSKKSTRQSIVDDWDTEEDDE
jgi:hypothetical protein